MIGTPAPTPALKKEWHSFSTPFKRVCTPFSTPITKFLESELPKPKNFLIRLNQRVTNFIVLKIFGGYYFQIIYCNQLLLTISLQTYQSKLLLSNKS